MACSLVSKFPVYPQPALRANHPLPPLRAARLDRRADLELSLGRTDVAERLAHQAAALRKTLS
jgi:hypothetical protein